MGHLPGYARFGQRVVGVYDVRPEATEGVREQFGVETVFGALDELLEPSGDRDRGHRDAPRGTSRARPAGAGGGQARAVAEAVRDRSADGSRARRRGRAPRASRSRSTRTGAGRPPGVRPPCSSSRAPSATSSPSAISTTTTTTSRSAPSSTRSSTSSSTTTRSTGSTSRAAGWARRPSARCGRVEYRTPNQPPESKAPWGAWATIDYEDGSSALIRGVGCAETSRPHKPFWIHGSEGTIRGTVLGGGPVPGEEWLELERDGRTTSFQLDGSWHTNGFAGTMGELITAIAERREPYNSARHNLLSLELTLAACLSAEDDGRPVAVEHEARPSRGARREGCRHGRRDRRPRRRRGVRPRQASRLLGRRGDREQGGARRRGRETPREPARGGGRHGARGSRARARRAQRDRWDRRCERRCLDPRAGRRPTRDRLGARARDGR